MFLLVLLSENFWNFWIGAGEQPVARRVCIPYFFIRCRALTLEIALAAVFGCACSYIYLAFLATWVGGVVELLFLF